MAWRRFFARMFDEILFSVLLIQVFDLKLFGHIDDSIQQLLLFLAFPILYVPLEALQVYAFRATLGKAIFGLTVTFPSGATSYALSLRRALLVWWRGEAAGIPILIVVALGIAYSRFLDTGNTSWDSDLGTAVTRARNR